MSQFSRCSVCLLFEVDLRLFFCVCHCCCCQWLNLIAENDVFEKKRDRFDDWISEQILSFFFLLLEKSIFGKFQISFELNNTLCVGSSMEVMVIAFYCQFLFIYIFHVNVFSAFRALIRKHYHYYSYQKMSVDGVPSEIGNCDCSCKCFFIRCRCRHRHHHCCWKCVLAVHDLVEFIFLNVAVVRWKCRLWAPYRKYSQTYSV